MRIRADGALVAFAMLALLGACAGPVPSRPPLTSSGAPSATEPAPATIVPEPTVTPTPAEETVPPLPTTLELGQTFALFYEPLLERVVLVNGATESGPERPTELWGWSGSAWELIDAAGPLARSFGAVARDPVRGVTVVHGGLRDRTSTFDQTLEWDGRDWTTHDAVPGAGPGPREGAGMAHDAATGSMILFGGATGFEQRPDTWTWDGVAWSQVAGVGPRPRFVSLMTADEATGDVIVQGGHWVDGNDGGFLGDTWRWNDEPEPWQEVVADGAEDPGPRVNSPGVFHPGLGGILMFGGGTDFDGRLADDTWLWRDGEWTELSTASAPSPRNGHALAYDAARDVVVLVGGIAEPGGSQILDVWEFDGTDWREVLAAT